MNLNIGILLLQNGYDSSLGNKDRASSISSEISEWIFLQSGVMSVRSRNSGSVHRSSILLANKSVVEKYQCDNFEHLLGFLCFHSMGHFSYLHDHPYIEQFGPYKTDLGFMDHGQNIIRMLQLNFDKNLNLEINADLEEGESASIRDLVRFTEVNYEQVISTFWYLFNRISIGN